MSKYKGRYRPGAPFFIMPNTGTILDAYAGKFEKGVNGQSVLNGGVSNFSLVCGAPNMFKSGVTTGMIAAVKLAFPHTFVHAHDTETTMSESRIGHLIWMGMHLPLPNYSNPSRVEDSDWFVLTRSVDYNGTELWDALRKLGKDRGTNEEKVAMEMLDPRTNAPYLSHVPIIEYWDSFSQLKTESAEDLLEEGDVGTADMNMLAMRGNKGKSDIVDHAPDLTAKYGIHLLCTAWVGQAYQLDPRKPNLKLLKALKGDIKLKRVPENTSFQSGNCYAIIGYKKLIEDDKSPKYPTIEYGKDDVSSNLVELTLSNMRGKYGLSDIDVPILVTQRDGLHRGLSNFEYLKEYAGRYGFTGNLQNYAFALLPEYKLSRKTVRSKLDESYPAQHAAYIMAVLHWTQYVSKIVPDHLICDPEQLYEDIKKLGYDWDLLLNCRYWHMTLEEGKCMPYISAMDLLKMRVGEYHPYWYPKTREEMGISPVVEVTA